MSPRWSRVPRGQWAEGLREQAGEEQGPCPAARAQERSVCEAQGPISGWETEVLGQCSRPSSLLGDQATEKRTPAELEAETETNRNIPYTPERGRRISDHREGQGQCEPLLDICRDRHCLHLAGRHSAWEGPGRGPVAFDSVCAPCGGHTVGLRGQAGGAAFGSRVRV